MFKVYKKDVVVKINGEDQTYSLLPLSGRFLPKLMGLASSKGDGSEEVNFEEKDFSVFHELILETLRFSYNIKDAKDLEEMDLFVSQNLIAFIPVLFEVNNLNGQEE